MRYIHVRTMSALFLILGGFFTVVAVYLLVVGIAKAPEGFEDETGFHLGTKDSPQAKVQIETKSPRGRSSVGGTGVRQPRLLAGASPFSRGKVGSVEWLLPLR